MRGIAIPTTLSRRCYRKFSSIINHPLYSIRGGNVDNEEYEDKVDVDDEEGEYDDYTQSFIASFESELAEIRRDAEEEAESEIQKLIDLIEHRDDAGGVEEGGDYSDRDHSHSDYDAEVQLAVTGKGRDAGWEEYGDGLQGEDDVNASGVGSTDDTSFVREESNEVVIPDTTGSVEKTTMEENEAGTKDNFIAIEIDGDEDFQRDPTDEDVVIETDEDSSTQDAAGRLDGEDGSDLVIETDEEDRPAESDSDFIPSRGSTADADAELVIEAHDDTIVVESDSQFIEDDVPSNDIVVEEVTEAIKRKKPKRRGKSSKKKGKGKKAKVRKSEPKGIHDVMSGGVNRSDDYDQEVIGVDGSVMLSHRDDELAQPKESGIWFYLRSDLGRAIGLFVATVLIAILTTRMQREMEALEAAATVGDVTP